MQLPLVNGFTREGGQQSLRRGSSRPASLLLITRFSPGPVLCEEWGGEGTPSSHLFQMQMQLMQEVTGAVFSDFLLPRMACLLSELLRGWHLGMWTGGHDRSVRGNMAPLSIGESGSELGHSLRNHVLMTL